MWIISNTRGGMKNVLQSWNDIFFSDETLLMLVQYSTVQLPRIFIMSFFFVYLTKVNKNVLVHSDTVLQLPMNRLRVTHATSEWKRFLSLHQENTNHFWQMHTLSWVCRKFATTGVKVLKLCRFLFYFAKPDREVFLCVFMCIQPNYDF